MKETVTSTQVRDVYAVVTNRIIELLEQGVVPWKKMWSESGQPQNMVTQKPYHGVNVLLLNSLNFPTNFFLTFRQITELGAKVRRDEKGIPIIFWKWIDIKNESEDEEKRKPLLRYYHVFNVSQCEEIPVNRIPIVSKPLEPIHECEVIVQNMPNRPVIRVTSEDPYYHLVEDFINMRDMSDFVAIEDYYDVLFHELAHSTGHASRLNRKEIVEHSKFGSMPYSIEELTAEMTSCFLKSHAGIPESTIENSASYIQSWLKVLKSDRKFIVYASAQAQRAADYILGMKKVE